MNGISNVWFVWQLRHVCDKLIKRLERKNCTLAWRTISKPYKSTDWKKFQCDTKNTPSTTYIILLLNVHHSNINLCNTCILKCKTLLNTLPPHTWKSTLNLTVLKPNNLGYENILITKKPNLEHACPIRCLLGSGRTVATESR